MIIAQRTSDLIQRIVLFPVVINIYGWGGGGRPPSTQRSVTSETSPAAPLVVCAAPLGNRLGLEVSHERDGYQQQRVISGLGKVFTGIFQFYIRSQVAVRSRDSVLISPVPPGGLNEVSAAARLQFLSWMVGFRAIQVTLILILRYHIGYCVDLASQKTVNFFGTDFVRETFY
jgi:hypothetical protein